jgi:hypothetical protein
VLSLFDLSGVPDVLVGWGNALTRFWSRWF